MSTTVCLSAKTLDYPQGGGHFWVFLNWALGLQAVGCDVMWLESVAPDTTPQELAAKTAALKGRLHPYGLANRLALASQAEGSLDTASVGCLDLRSASEADLLLNFRYGLSPKIVHQFHRSALVDIDPGLLQIWMSLGQLSVAPHDLYFTTGETVGTRAARFPDCGVRWHYVPPAVFLPAWPPTEAGAEAPYSTISDWWGGWVLTGSDYYDNSKRASFLEYADLPREAPRPLELALCLGPGDEQEQQQLERRGWRTRHAWEVCATPDEYGAYIRDSRGEFSCAKPSCMRLANAWVSDRTLCYLASGKPAIVQHTGASRFLPSREGLFRFTNREEASEALRLAESDYSRHCRAARALAEEHFDARKIARRVLETALAS